MVIVTLIGFLIWVNRYSVDKEARLARRIFATDLLPPPLGVADCFEALPLTGKGGWQRVSGGIERENSARHIRIRIEPIDGGQRVEIFTRNGAPLRDSERAVVTRCIAR